MKKPSLNALDNSTLEKPTENWANFVDNFLHKFFEGGSFTIWLFVSGILLILYSKYSHFNNSIDGNTFHILSILALFLLIIGTLIKNFLIVNPWNLGDLLRSRISFINAPPYKIRYWVANVVGSESAKLDIPLRIINFRQIYAEVSIVNTRNGRWRAGFVFNSIDGKKEYIFHAYQDQNDPSFRARIVEREPEIREMPKDINKQIGIKSPRNFRFWVEINKKNLEFYIDGISVGYYKVPLSKIGNIQIAAWSDNEPVEILFKNIQAEV